MPVVFLNVKSGVVSHNVGPDNVHAMEVRIIIV